MVHQEFYGGGGRGKRRCPNCGSTHTEVEGDEGFSFLICFDCGYDESMEYEADLGDRKGSKGKKGSPYKRGGALRTQRRKK